MIRKILKSKKGFTLVETLTAVLLLSVLIGLACSIMLFSMNVFSRSSGSTSAQTLANSAYSFISNRLIYADNIEVGSNNSGYDQAIEIQDGKLYFNNGSGGSMLMLDDSSYNGMTLGTTTSINGPIMTLTVTVTYGSGQKYERTGSFKMINIARAESASVSGTTASAADQPIYFN